MKILRKSDNRLETHHQYLFLYLGPNLGQLAERDVGLDSDVDSSLSTPLRELNIGY